MQTRIALLFLLVALNPVAATARTAAPATVLTDKRLQRPQSLQVRAQPLGELMHQLSKLTGVQLLATAEVADERVTLFTHDEPLGRSLQAMTDLLELRWSRDREGYELGRDLAVRQRDEALCQAKQEGTLRALDARVGSCLGFLDRSPEALQAEQDRLEDELTGAQGAAQGRLQQQLDAISLARQPLARPCLLLFRRLSPAQRQLLLTGAELRLSSTPSPPAARLPTELLPLFQQSPLPAPESLRRSLGSPEERAVDVSLRLIQTPQLAQLAYEVATRAKTTGISFTQPWQISSPIEAPAPAAAMAGKGRALFPHPVRLDLKPYSQQFGRLVVESSGRTVADLAAAVAAATGRNVVADAFTKPDFRVPGGADMPLGDYLDVAAASAGCRWDEKDGYIRFRDLTYFCDRHTEVPATDLRRWQEAVGATGQLSLDDMGEICARLTRDQLATLVTYWPAFFGRRWQPQPAPQYLITRRPELRWYGLLTAGQQAQLKAGHLLTWRELLPRQRAELMQRITDPRDPLGLNTRSGHADQQVDARPEALARAAFGLRFDQQPVQYFADPSGLNAGFNIGDPGNLLREDGALGRQTNRIELRRDTETVATFVYLLPTVSGADLVTQSRVLTTLSGPLKAGSPPGEDHPGTAARVPDAKPHG